MGPGAGFTKGLNPDQDLRLRLFSKTQVKSVVLNLRWFHKTAKSKFWLSLSGVGLTFVKKDLNMAAVHFSNVNI